MYFAVQPTLPDVPEKISDALADLCRAKRAAPPNVFALVDGVFDEKLLSRKPWSRQSKCSLYEATSLSEFGEASPHLLAAPDDPAKWKAWLQQITAACSGKPMLSFMASTLAIDVLQIHFRPYLVARSQDLTEWPLRWGDTRVLPEILSVIEPGHYEHLMSPLYTWWSIKRDGSLLALNGGAVFQSQPTRFDKLPLSDKEFSRLVDRAEADAVLANIHDTHADLLQKHTPSECHARVTKHLLIADENGIKAANARQHFSMLALSLNESFTRHPAMIVLLKHTQRGGDYVLGIKSLPEQFWQDVG